MNNLLHRLNLTSCRMHTI